MRWFAFLVITSIILLSCSTTGEVDSRDCPEVNISYWISRSPSDSIPASGVDVYVFDQKGDTLHGLTDSSGAFHLSGSLCLPVRARIEKDGNTNEMATWQQTVDCSTCHYPGNNRGAPGYIYTGGGR